VRLRVQDARHGPQSRLLVVRPDARARSITFLRLFARICDASVYLQMLWAAPRTSRPDTRSYEIRSATRDSSWPHACLLPRADCV